jgi:pimeloyl-ACP methyl ester carboxylesterase
MAGLVPADPPARKLVENARMTARGGKRAAAGLAAAGAALALNRFVTGRETKPAQAGRGRLVPTALGEIHVLEEGGAAAAPIVLLHGFAGSLHWFDRLAPLLARDHRVVRLDALGHGCSEKPASGYTIPEQAAAVDQALTQLGVASAPVVGHSMGAAVAVALAERNPALVERLTIIDEGPDNGFGDQPLMTTLGFVPVIGELFHRLSFDAAIRDGYGDAFAKDFDLASGFDDPDQVVHDYRNMTYRSYADSWDGEESFLRATRLDERVRRLGIPTLVIFGEQDGFFHADECVAAFRAVPVTRVEVLAGAGHSPNVERPADVARLVGEHAAVAAG